MLKNTFLSGFLSIFYSLGTNSMEIWSDNTGHDGSVNFVIDGVLCSNVLEMSCEAQNLPITSIQCPGTNLTPNTLGISLPFITFQMKNMNKLVSLEIEVKSHTGAIFYFQCANWTTKTSVTSDFCSIPLVLTSGWNSVTLDLQTLCQKVFGSGFSAVERVRVHGSTRIRRIFLSDKFPVESDLPPELQLSAPESATVSVAKDS
jgi:hypothetical protein